MSASARAKEGTENVAHLHSSPCVKQRLAASLLGNYICILEQRALRVGVVGLVVASLRGVVLHDDAGVPMDGHVVVGLVGRRCWVAQMAAWIRRFDAL